jgi:DNA-binding response OmpR family regulator
MKAGTEEGRVKLAGASTRATARGRGCVGRLRDDAHEEKQQLLGTPAEQQGAEELPRVAILDADRGFMLVLDNRLRGAGFAHVFLRRAPQPEALVALELDALVVDVALLGSNRLDWLARVCKLRPDLDVLVCTHSSTVAERVRALRAGVADWLGKPCHPEELIARVEAITCSRRGLEQRDLRPLSCGELEIRPDQFQAFVGDRSLGLTRREYGLLELLARADGESLSREQLYETVWGRPMQRSDRSVDVFVHKLRGKLIKASPRFLYIHTEFRFGYRLAAEPVDGVPVLAASALAQAEKAGSLQQPLAA